MTQQQHAPFQPESTPLDKAPQTAPKLPNYADERDSLHVATSLASVREKLGELTGSVNSMTLSLSELKGDVKSLDARVVELKTEQVVTARSISLLRWIATPLLGITALFAPYLWNSIMRPEMEKSVAEKVKAAITKEQADRDVLIAKDKKIAELEAKLAAKK